jgi:hypothetical protein
MKMSGELHTPVAISSRKISLHSLDTRLGGPQSRSGLCENKIQYCSKHSATEPWQSLSACNTAVAEPQKSSGFKAVTVPLRWFNANVDPVYGRRRRVHCRHLWYPHWPHCRGEVTAYNIPRHYGGYLLYLRLSLRWLLGCIAVDFRDSLLSSITVFQSSRFSLARITPEIPAAQNAVRPTASVV